MTARTSKAIVLASALSLVGAVLGQRSDGLKLVNVQIFPVGRKWVPPANYGEGTVISPLSDVAAVLDFRGALAAHAYFRLFDGETHVPLNSFFVAPNEDLVVVPRCYKGVPKQVICEAFFSASATLGVRPIGKWSVVGLGTGRGLVGKGKPDGRIRAFVRPLPKEVNMSVAYDEGDPVLAVQYAPHSKQERVQQIRVDALSYGPSVHEVGGVSRREGHFEQDFLVPFLRDQSNARIVWNTYYGGSGRISVTFPRVQISLRGGRRVVSVIDPVSPQLPDGISLSFPVQQDVSLGRGLGSGVCLTSKVMLSKRGVGARRLDYVNVVASPSSFPFGGEAVLAGSGIGSKTLVLMRKAGPGLYRNVKINLAYSWSTPTHEFEAVIPIDRSEQLTRKASRRY